MYAIEPLYIDGLAPIKAHEDDAAFDLRSAESVGISLYPNARTLIPCGVAIAIPDGHVGLIVPRSGLALKYGITVLNAPGVIDPGYRGDIGVVLMNLGTKVFIISPGDRIAQLLILPNSNFRLVQSKNALGETARGSGGFGSTGTHDAPNVPRRILGIDLDSAECRHINPRPTGPACTCAPPSCALERVDL